MKDIDIEAARELRNILKKKHDATIEAIDALSKLAIRFQVNDDAQHLMTVWTTESTALYLGIMELNQYIFEHIMAGKVQS